MSLRDVACRALKIAEEAFVIACNAQHLIPFVYAALTNTTVNSAAVVAGASITTPATADLPTQSATPTAFLVSAVAFVNCNAVDHACTFQLIEDPAGAATVFGPIVTADSSHVNGNVAVTIPVVKRTPPGGAVRKYALRVATAGGSTVTVALANESSVTVQPLG